MSGIKENMESAGTPEQPKAWREGLSDTEKSVLDLFGASGADPSPVLEKLEHLAPGAVRSLFDLMDIDSKSLEEARRDSEKPGFRKSAVEKLKGLMDAVDDKQLIEAIPRYNANVARIIAARFLGYKHSLGVSVELLLRPEVAKLLNEIHSPRLQDEAVKWFMLGGRGENSDVEGLCAYLTGEGKEVIRFADAYDLPEMLRKCVYAFAFDELESVGDRTTTLGRMQDLVNQLRATESQPGGKELIEGYSRACRKLDEQPADEEPWSCIDVSGFAKLLEHIRAVCENPGEAVAAARRFHPFRGGIVFDFNAALDQAQDADKKVILDFIRGPGDLGEMVKRVGFFAAFGAQHVRVPAPTLDPEWLRGIRARAGEAVANKFGAETIGAMDPDTALEFLGIQGEAEELGAIADILKHHEQYAGQKAEHFPLGKEYGSINVSGLKIRQSPADATEALVYGLFSKLTRPTKDASGEKITLFQTEPLRKALTQFEKEKLKNARTALQGLAPRKIYAHLKNEIETLKDRTRSAGERAEAAEAVRKYLKEEVCPKMGDRKRESLSDLIDSVEGIGKAGRFDGVQFKTQRGEPGDLLDNRSTMCCAFYPDGANKHAANDYFRDPYIVTLQAKPFTRSAEGLVEGSAPIGVAICLLCKDENGESALLVDSVEGGRDFQRIPERQWATAYMEALKALAKDAGAKRLVVGAKSSNATPQAFVNFLRSEGFREQKMNLEKLGDTSKKMYLEFFAQGDEVTGDAGVWREPKGNENAIVIELSS